MSPIGSFTSPGTPIDSTETTSGSVIEETSSKFDAVLDDASGQVAPKASLPRSLESTPEEETPVDIIVTDDAADESERAPEAEEAEPIVLSSCLAAWQILPPPPPLQPQTGNLRTEGMTNDVLCPSLEMPVVPAPTTDQLEQPPTVPTQAELTPQPTVPPLTQSPRAEAAAPTEAAPIEANAGTIIPHPSSEETTPPSPIEATRSEKAALAANAAKIQGTLTSQSPAESPRSELDGIPVAKEHRAMTETVSQHPAKTAPAAFADGEKPTAPNREWSPETVMGAASAEASGYNDARGSMSDGPHERSSSESFHLPAGPDRIFEPESSVVETPVSSDTTQLIQNIERAIERMRSQGSQRMELRLPMQNGEEVIVKLRIEQGEVKASFRSDSEGLRQALEAGWSQVTQSSSERSVRAATTITESSSLPSGSGHFQQSPDQRDRRGNERDFEAAFTPLAGTTELKKPTSPLRTAMGNKPSANLALYA